VEGVLVELTWLCRVCREEWSATRADQSPGRVLHLSLARPLTKPTTMRDLTFIARRGCVCVADMQFNLDDALLACGWRRDYQFIDSGALEPTDERRGYPTPTLLWKRKDIFGMPVPEPPYDVPS
jgi:hypothetical protein